MKALDRQPAAVKLSIIVANWNTRGLLSELLRSIEQHVPVADCEVIVIDNGSSDGSVEMIRREIPWAVILQNEKNLGYAHANNQGYEHARGEYILLLGSDTVVVDDSIQRMVRYLSSHADVGAVSCRLLNPDRSLQPSCRRFPSLWDGVLTYLSLHRIASQYNMHGFDFYATQEVEQPAATSLMIRRTALDGSGLFDERFSILYNDVELCMRIHRAGWKIVYLGDAEVIHHGSQSTRRASPELRLGMYRNILLYYRLYVHPLSGWLLRPILAIRLILATRSGIGFRLFSETNRE